MFIRFLAHACVGITAAFSTAALADSIDDMVGDYHLVSSNTVPDSNWGFNKGRIAISRIDDQHLAIVLACGWKERPTHVCRERHYAQQRGGAIYLQDMNTSYFKMSFDPAARRLTVVSRGVDAERSVRHDVYEATSAPLTDTDLVRRMRREQKVVDDGVDFQIFGPLKKWEFRNNRIAFRSKQ